MRCEHLPANGTETTLSETTLSALPLSALFIHHDNQTSSTSTSEFCWLRVPIPRATGSSSLHLRIQSICVNASRLHCVRSAASTCTSMDACCLALVIFMFVTPRWLQCRWTHTSNMESVNAPHFSPTLTLDRKIQDKSLTHHRSKRGRVQQQPALLKGHPEPWQSLVNAVVFAWRHADTHRNLMSPTWCSSPTRTEPFRGQYLPAHVNQSDRRNGQSTSLTPTQGKRHTCRRSAGPSMRLVDDVPIFSTRSAATLHLSSRMEPSCSRIVSVAWLPFTHQDSNATMQNKHTNL